MHVGTYLTGIYALFEENLKIFIIFYFTFLFSGYEGSSYYEVIYYLDINYVC